MERSKSGENEILKHLLIISNYSSHVLEYGKVIIAERYLPNEQKSIKPIDQELMLHYTIEVNDHN